MLSLIAQPLVIMSGQRYKFWRNLILEVFIRTSRASPVLVKADRSNESITRRQHVRFCMRFERTSLKLLPEQRFFWREV